MGANFDSVIIQAKDVDELRFKFGNIVADRRHQNGYGGYTGTFAENSADFVLQQGEWERDLAWDDCIDNHEKWEAPWAYRLRGDDDLWFIGAWCSC